jgi:hypothetical protein
LTPTAFPSNLDSLSFLVGQWWPADEKTGNIGYVTFDANGNMTSSTQTLSGQVLPNGSFSDTSSVQAGFSDGLITKYSRNQVIVSFRLPNGNYFYQTWTRK